MYSRNPSEVLTSQHLLIAHAIELLQNELDTLADTTDPENATWRDVGKFAHTADMAREIIGVYGDA